ncbi:MAG: 16S rRNA (adenine(1518)-N(6)/adenine(1519)-N(6))-dimethyltransferase RsmA [Candidatus Syntropharchaeia archaeon]
MEGWKLKINTLLKEYGIRPLRGKDQHFLVDEDVVRRQVLYADVSKSDEVLEIGAGIGILTEELEKKAKKVYAIEKDRKLVKILEDRCPEAEIICGDALEMDFPDFNKVVSNLPYSISSKITFKLFEYEFEIGILMYQYEFARRMTADPGGKEYGRLSVGTRYFSDAHILEVVPKTAFYPVPKVDSAIVSIIPEKRFSVPDEKFFFRIVNLLFSHRRKKIKNTLKIAGFDASLVLEFVEKRPEELSIEDFVEIAKRLSM